MKRKRLVITNLIIVVAVFGGNYFYQSLNFFHPFKIICSSGFAIMGILNLIYAYKRVENTMLLIFTTLGLIFAFLGDIAINPNFVLGVIFFALGHVFFVIAYVTYKKLCFVDIAISLGLGVFSIAFILFFSYIVFESAILKYVVLVYAGIISIMVGKSIGNLVSNRCAFSGIIVIGSILFFISDMMLLLAWFSSVEGRWTSHICMATYYPALCLLAISIVVYQKDCRDRLIMRVKEMENSFQIIQAMFAEDRNVGIDDEEIQKHILFLKEYQETGQWLKDYESDERGELPVDLNRGVLSEDELYNLLSEVDGILST